MPVALAAGLTRTDVARAGGEPDARGRSGFDGALLRAADELHAQSFVSDATWAALAERYDRHQLMDAVFTVAHYSMWAMTVNTIGVAAGEAGGVPMPAALARTGTRDHRALTVPRVPPLDPPDWTPAVRAMLDPTGNGRPVANVYRTYAQHPALYAPRQLLSEVHPHRVDAAAAGARDADPAHRVSVPLRGTSGPRTRGRGAVPGCRPTRSSGLRRAPPRDGARRTRRCSRRWTTCSTTTAWRRPPGPGWPRSSIAVSCSTC